ncbi:MAG: HlyD family secretion protein [Hyphomicrobiaceae bacterium]
MYDDQNRGPMNRMWWLIVALAVLAGAGGYASLSMLKGVGNSQANAAISLADARTSSLFPRVAVKTPEPGRIVTAQNVSDGQNREPEWVAAAPGRVEPKSGEIRIGTPILGRVKDVRVKVGSVVEADEVVISLDDDEARARLAAAEAEAGARKQDRDRQKLDKARESVRNAEDDVYNAERALTGARIALDSALAAQRDGRGSTQDVQSARNRLKQAQARLAREQIELANAASKSGLPAPDRSESAVSAGRAEVAMAEAVLEKTRIRAPRAGTVLQINAKRGEIVAPSPDVPLAVIGDMSAMRVIAEVDAGDVAKVAANQEVFVRSTSYPGRTFEGRVTSIAPTLSPPRIGARGPRRATDVEVLEVIIELNGGVPLKPGMRADVFFRPRP